MTRADRFEATDDFRDAFIQQLSTVTSNDPSTAAMRAIRKEGNVRSMVAQERHQDKVAALPEPVPPSGADPRVLKTRPSAKPGSVGASRKGFRGPSYICLRQTDRPRRIRSK